MSEEFLNFSVIRCYDSHLTESEIANLTTVGYNSVVYRKTVVNEASERPFPNTATMVRNIQKPKTNANSHKHTHIHMLFLYHWLRNKNSTKFCVCVCVITFGG